jgi:hypothetical protein
MFGDVAIETGCLHKGREADIRCGLHRGLLCRTKLPLCALCQHNSVCGDPFEMPSNAAQ